MKLENEYATSEFVAKVKQWLFTVADRLAVSMNLVCKDNESSLYPLLWDLLKEVCLLSNEATTVSSRVTNEASLEEKTLAAGMVALSVKARQSFSTKGSAESACEAADESGDEEVDEIPEMANTADAADVLSVYIAVEKQLRKPTGGGGSAGRVEFALCVIGTIRTILEAKLSLIADKGKGFFQACSYMCNVFYATYRDTGEYPDVVYGVYTDHMVWQFIQLRKATTPTGKPTITCTKTFNFTDSEGTALLPSAIDVLQYLFQCASVPATFSVAECVSAVEEKSKEYGDQLVACFK